jgi:hypothetical protein
MECLAGCYAIDSRRLSGAGLFQTSLQTIAPENCRKPDGAMDGPLGITSEMLSAGNCASPKHAGCCSQATMHHRP